MNRIAKIMVVGAASLCLAASVGAQAAPSPSKNSNCSKGHHCPALHPQKHNNRKESNDCSSGTINQNIKCIKKQHDDLIKQMNLFYSDFDDKDMI